MRKLIHTLRHFNFPAVGCMQLCQGLVNLVGVVQIHVEEAHCELWRPVVEFSMSTHIVVCLCTVALVNQMKCLAVFFILLWA